MTRNLEAIQRALDGDIANQLPIQGFDGLSPTQTQTHRGEMLAQVVAQRTTFPNNAAQPYYPGYHQNVIQALFAPAPQPTLVAQPYISLPDVVQRDTTASVTEGADIDLTGNLKSFSVSYAVATLQKLLVENESLKMQLIATLTWKLTPENILPWIQTVKKVYDVLKTISSIPAGVVAVFLWGVGKLWLWCADTFYNGRRLSAMFGEVTEKSIYDRLKLIADGHQAIQTFIANVEYYAGLIKDYLLSGNMAEEEATTETSTTVETVSDTSNKFLSLKVEPPELTAFDIGERKRAGLEANASAHVRLLGQDLGGDVKVQLPFGKGWQVAVAPFFKTSSITIGSFFKIGDITGDRLVFNNEGLESVQMSVNQLNIAGEVVKADKIQVTYSKTDDQLEFLGKGSVQLWGDKRLDGNLQLILGTDGKFREAEIGVSSSATFAAIPSYLDIIEPGGMVHFYVDRAPDVLIRSGIGIKGIPGGITANAEGGVRYLDSDLSGFLTNLDINIPLSKAAKLQIVIIDGEFSKKGVSAKNAYIDFDYDKALLEDSEEATSPSTLFGDSSDLGWLDVTGKLGLEKLNIRQGLANIIYKDGKFDYTKDDSSGLRQFKARLFGVSAEYNGIEGSGSLAGEIYKEIGFPLVAVDFPLAYLAGATLELSGEFGFGANVRGSLKKNMERSEPSKTVLILGGGFGAEASAALKLLVGAYVGIPYLAKLDAGLYGKVKGAVEGDVSLTGGVIYEGSRLHRDTENPPAGTFELTGILSAAVGGQIRGKVLFFSKNLVAGEFGNWELGKYQIKGAMVPNEDGKYSVKIAKQGFEGGKPEPVNVKEKTLGTGEWIDGHAEEGNKVARQKKGEITKNVRNIVYGKSDESPEAHIIRYDKILGTKGEKEWLNTEWNRISEEAASRGASFIWSKAIWNEAVKRRKVLLLFEQSRSKAKIGDLIGRYHKTELTDRSARLAILEQIKPILKLYISQKSKDESNIKEAKQLQSQIALEEALLTKG